MAGLHSSTRQRAISRRTTKLIAAKYNVKATQRDVYHYQNLQSKIGKELVNMGEITALISGHSDFEIHILGNSHDFSCT